MAGDNNIAQEPRRQWRDVVQASVGRNDRLKRNVLEIALEKESYNDEVDEEVLLQFFRYLGIKKEYVEGVQSLPPKSPRKVLPG